MSKRAKLPHQLSASWLAVLDRVAAALEQAFAEALAREEAVAPPGAGNFTAELPEEWRGVLSRMDEHTAEMGRRLDDVTRRMEALAAFLEQEEHACQGRHAELRRCGEKLARLAAHSVS